LPVLIVSDQPGRLHSNASPPPGGPPQHPFLDGTALDALSESQLGKLLRAAHSFDDYLAALIAAGYDIGSDDTLARSDPGPGARLADASGLLGALWQHSGQFTTLTHQPEPGQLIFAAAAVTLYREECGEDILKALSCVRTYKELVQVLRDQGILFQSTFE
jgi:hypothetical protein